jgi:hypothetical protein
MLGTVDILDDNDGTDTTAATNSTTSTTTDADHVLSSCPSRSHVCMYVCCCSWKNEVPSLSFLTVQYSVHATQSIYQTKG